MHGYAIFELDVVSFKAGTRSGQIVILPNNQVTTVVALKFSLLTLRPAAARRMGVFFHQKSCVRINSPIHSI